jgi:hypothetical protein
MEKRGEIIIVRQEASPEAQNKPRNVYVQGTLCPDKNFTEERTLEEERRPLVGSAQAWRDVYPEFFTPPNMTGTVVVHEERS